MAKNKGVDITSQFRDAWANNRKKAEQEERERVELERQEEDKRRQEEREDREFFEQLRKSAAQAIKNAEAAGPVEHAHMAMAIGSAFRREGLAAALVAAIFNDPEQLKRTEEFKAKKKLENEQNGNNT